MASPLSTIALDSRSSLSGISPSSGFVPSSLDPLPSTVRHGMIAMGILGLLSTASTLSLLGFITYRMIYWRRYYNQSLARNQIFVLIYNLLLADLQQALSFLIAFHWIAENRLVGPTKACFVQGWLIQIGDLSSGLWVLAIAVHTFYNLVVKKTLPMGIFIASVIGLWLFCLFLSAIGPIIRNDHFFVPAGAWCWIGEAHESDRLYLHYLWIFISQLGSLVIYATIFIFLHMNLPSLAHALGTSSLNNQPGPTADLQATGSLTTTPISTNASPEEVFAQSRKKILRTARYMVVYPFAYVALSLPLAVGRVSAMAGKRPSLVSFCVAGSLMASCGIVDVLLYVSTRKALVKSSVGMKSADTDSKDRLNRFRSRELRYGANLRMNKLHIGRGIKGTNQGNIENDGTAMLERNESVKSLIPAEYSKPPK